MSKQSSNKSDRILDAAAELFATRPFHEVKLDDIAAAAKVGKGTVYLYWSSKEEVYLTVVRRGFAAVLERVEAELAARPRDGWGALEAIVGALVDFAFAYPGVYQIMRMTGLMPGDPELQRTRGALTARIEGVLRDGVARGEFADPEPALTTQYVMSFVRGAALYPPAGLTAARLRAHIMGVLRGGLRPVNGAGRDTRGGGV